MDRDAVLMAAQGDQLMCESWDEFAMQPEDWREDFQSFMKIIMDNDKHPALRLMAQFAAVGFTNAILSKLEAEEGV